MAHEDTAHEDMAHEDTAHEDHDLLCVGLME